MKIEPKHQSLMLEIQAMMYTLQTKFDTLFDEANIKLPSKVKYTLKNAYAEIDKEMTIQLSNSNDVNVKLFLADVDKLVQHLTNFHISIETKKNEFLPYAVEEDKKFIAGHYIGKTPLEVAAEDPAYVLRHIENKQIVSSKKLLDICLKSIKESKLRTKL